RLHSLSMSVESGIVLLERLADDLVEGTMRAFKCGPARALAVVIRDTPASHLACPGHEMNDGCLALGLLDDDHGDVLKNLLGDVAIVRQREDERQDCVAVFKQLFDQRLLDHESLLSPRGRTLPEVSRKSCCQTWKSRN